jgi:hypothetical protein
MRAYNLPQNVHYCEIGGQRVFLDLASDRYFRLPAAADAAFSSLASAGVDSEACAEDIMFLLRSGVLVDAPQGRPIARTSSPRPNGSLLEGIGPYRPFAPAILAETWFLVSGARRAVARKKLPAYLRALGDKGAWAAAAPVAERANAVGQFRAARRYVPAAPNCLYDSLALCRFLRRRGIGATLVIGVKLHPFAAHCWLQDGEEVLNDSLGAARDFEPIFAI